MMLSEKNYPRLRRERAVRIKLASDAIDRAALYARKAGQRGHDRARAAWSHAAMVRLRVAVELRNRGGVPQPGAPR